MEVDKDRSHLVVFECCENFFYQRELYECMNRSEEYVLELLLDCTLFQGMSREEISRVLSGHLGRVKSYSRDVLIAQAGDEVRSLQILLSGTVKGEMVDYTGKVIKIEDISPPRPLAPAFLFGKLNRYPVNITSGDEATILSIPRDRFLRILQESEKVLVNFINIVSSRGQFLSSKIKFLSFSTIKGKLAHYLLDLSRQAGSNSFVLPHSQTQLSELFGVARPSIGRAISEMNRDGIFRTEGKRVVILDQPGLTSYLN
jgi:CRP-like cAMP-binding protein